METNKHSFFCRVFLSQVGWQDGQGIGESHKNDNKLKQSVNVKRSKFYTRNHPSGVLGWSITDFVTENLCLIGDCPFSVFLDDMLRYKTVAGINDVRSKYKGDCHLKRIQWHFKKALILL